MPQDRDWTQSVRVFDDPQVTGEGWRSMLARSEKQLAAEGLQVVQARLGTPRWTGGPTWSRPLVLDFEDDLTNRIPLLVNLPWPLLPSDPAPAHSERSIGGHQGLVWEGRAMFVVRPLVRRPGVRLVRMPHGKPKIVAHVVPVLDPAWSMEVINRRPEKQRLLLRSDRFAITPLCQVHEQQAKGRTDVSIQVDSGSCPAQPECDLDVAGHVWAHLQRAGLDTRFRSGLESDLRRLNSESTTTQFDLDACRLLVETLVEVNRQALDSADFVDALRTDRRPTDVLDRETWSLVHYPAVVTDALGRGLSRALRRIKSTFAQAQPTAKRKPKPAAWDKVEVIRAGLAAEFSALATGRPPYLGLVVQQQPTNTIAQAELLRQATFLGPRGIPPVNGNLSWRNIDEGWEGTLCPLHTPEGKKIGLVRHLAADAPHEFLDGGGVDEEYGSLSIPGSLVPFVNHNDPTRSAIVTKMFGQSLAVDGAEPALVGTGMEQWWAERIGVLRSPRRATVVAATPDSIVLDDGSTLRFGPADPADSGQDRTWARMVAVGDDVSRGQVLARAADVRLLPEAADRPVLAPGLNALVAFTTWAGWNYEDGIVVSNSFADRMASSHVVKVRFDLGPEFAAPDSYLVELLTGDLRCRAGSPIASVSLSGRTVEILAPEDGTVVPSSAGSPYRYLELNDTEVTYRVLVHRRLEVGDKMTTRHGGKGVVTKIENDHDMPAVHFPDGTTRPAEVLLNPLGVVRRLNIGTLLELSWSLRLRLDPSATGTAPRALGRPARQELEAELTRLGASGGRLPISVDGSSFGPAVGVPVGDLYLMKLHHTAQSKAGARHDAQASPLTFQPSRSTPWTPRGARGAPQRFGEMEVWAALASGSTLLVRDVLNDRGVGQGSLRGAELVPPALRAASAMLAATGIAVDALTDDGVVCLSTSPRVPPSSIKSLENRPVLSGGFPELADLLDQFPDRKGVSARVQALEIVEELSRLDGRTLDPARALARETLAFELRWQTPLRPIGRRNLADGRTSLVLPPSAGLHPRSGDLAMIRRIVADVITLRRSESLKAPLPAVVDSAARQLHHALRNYLGDWTDRPADKTVAGRLSGKFGVLRRNLLGASTVRSARAVIVADPERSIETIGLPRWMLDALGVPASPVGDEDVVILNRQPTLHPYNLVALRAEVSPHQALSIHPHLLHGLAGDFDGDTAAVHRPASEAARAEAWLHHRPARNLRHAGTAAPLVTFDLDIALGLELQPPDLPGVPEVPGPAVASVKAALVAAATDADADTDTDTDTDTTLGRIWSTMKKSWSDSSAWQFSLFQAAAELEGLEPDTAGEPGPTSAELPAAFGRVLSDPGSRENVPDLHDFALGFVAGACGKEADLGQLLKSRGSVELANPFLNSRSVAGNYLDGIGSTDFFLTAQASITGLAAKKLVTPRAGALTRRLVQLVYGRVISAVDCGSVSDLRSPLTCTFRDTCQVCYGPHPGTGQPAPIGTRIGLLAATLIGAQSTQLSMKAIHQRESGTVFGGGLDELSGLFTWGSWYLPSAGGRPKRTTLHNQLGKAGPINDPLIALVEAQNCFARLLPSVVPVHADVVLRTLYDGFLLAQRTLGDKPKRSELWAASLWRSSGLGSAVVAGTPAACLQPTPLGRGPEHGDHYLLPLLMGGIGSEVQEAHR